MVSNPKGGNQVPSIRIRCRLIFHVFSTSYEKRFSIKITLSSSRFKNLLWSRTRREEIKCPLSESAVDSFFHVFSTSYEKCLSIKMTLFSSRFKNLLWSRTRREE